MKTLRRLLGLYNEAELTAFGNLIAKKQGDENERRVWASDVENFKLTLKNE